jgi:RHS repeat-associated protein
VQRVIVSDRLGSVRWRSDTGAMKYYPYGEEPVTTASGREKFGTYHRDQATNLDYADQRYYASGFGRFLTPDPYKASGGPGDPGSWNQYGYAGGDPVNRVDPKGLYWESLGYMIVGYDQVMVGYDSLTEDPMYDAVPIWDEVFQWVEDPEEESGSGSAGGRVGDPTSLARSLMQTSAAAARDALGKTRCLDLFGSGRSDAQAILEKMVDTAKYRDVGSDYVAKYNTVKGSITINTHTGSEGTYWNTEWYLQTVENAVTLLHELGHATKGNKGNQFLNDTSLFGRSDPQKAWQNDSLIWEDCFNMSNPFKRPE